jgi:putative tryptophan/tyrosine transport system substrate-binding protein
MRRREFITSVSGAVALPLTAYAQKPDGVRLGVLMPFATTDPSSKLDVAALVGQLQALGWTEGRNIRIDYRWAAGNAEQMEPSAKDLVAQKPDVIFCRSTPVTASLLKQTRTIPIVFSMVSDPIGERFVESLARPGGNATGFTNVESSMAGKWLELLKEVAPNIKRITYIFDPRVAPGGGTYYANLIESAAPSFAVALAATPYGSGMTRVLVFYERPDPQYHNLTDHMGVYSRYGIIGVLLGVITPICLFTAAAFIALGTKGRP